VRFKNRLQGLLDLAWPEFLRHSARTTVALATAADVRRQEIVDLLARWALLRAQMERTDEEIAALVVQCPPAQALATVPEVGPVCAATIVAELGTPMEFESPRRVLALAGMDLSDRSSGTSVRSGRRQSKRGRPMLRRELYAALPVAEGIRCVFFTKPEAASPATPRARAN